MSRTRLAPTPTNISTKSEPEMVKKGTSASPAIALASRVLPVPGGPTIRTPLGMRPPSFWNFFGILEELDQLLDFVLGLLDAGDVLEGDLVLVAGQHPRAALAEIERPLPAMRICWRKKKYRITRNSPMGRNADQGRGQQAVDSEWASG